MGIDPPEHARPASEVVDLSHEVRGGRQAYGIRATVVVVKVAE